jgi:hypothetical protein
MDLIERLIRNAAQDGIKVTFNPSDFHDYFNGRSTDAIKRFNAFYAGYTTHNKYAPGVEIICMNPELYPTNTDLRVLPTLLHELAHATGVPHRLNREVFKAPLNIMFLSYGHTIYRMMDVEELIAEGAAHKVIQYLGVECGRVSSGYNYLVRHLPPDLYDIEVQKINYYINEAADYIITQWINKESRVAA